MRARVPRASYHDSRVSSAEVECTALFLLLAPLLGVMSDEGSTACLVPKGTSPEKFRGHYAFAVLPRIGPFLSLATRVP